MCTIARLVIVVIAMGGRRMTEPSYKKIFLCLSCLFFILAIARPVKAQQQEITTRVSSIAGSVIYLTSGSNDGISNGDTLYVYLEEDFLGALIVQNVASESLASEFAAQPFPITRGQTLILRIDKPPETEMVREEAPAGVTAQDKSILEESGTGASSARGGFNNGPRVSGRIQMGGTALSTQTKWSSLQNDKTNRLFLTPNTHLSTYISNLPGGLGLDASISYSYRYSNRSSISPSHYARFYRLNIEKTFDTIPLSITAGRFYNRYEIFSGFWDGMMLRIGNRTNGVGLIAGFEPIRSNEGFQTDLPKYSAYTYHEFETGPVRSSTELDVTAVMPGINLDNHIYAGLFQQFRLNRHRISVRLQADQNPNDKQWSFSQVMVRGLLEVTEELQLHGAFNRRRPYRIYSLINPLGFERTSITGGARYHLRKISLGSDLNSITSDYGPRAYSISGYVQANRTPLWDLDMSANAQYWFNDNYTSLRLSPALSRDFNTLHVSLGYEFYQTDYFSGQYHTHTGTLSAMMSINRQWFLQGTLRSGYSDLFINNSLQFSIWRSF